MLKLACKIMSLHAKQNLDLYRPVLLLGLSCKEPTLQKLAFVGAVCTTTGFLQCTGGIACFEYAPWD